MKPKYILIPLLSGAAMLTACKDKPAPAATSSNGDSAPAVVDGGTPANEETPSAKVTPEERAQKLGFAKHIPKDVSSFEAFYNGRKAFDQMLGSPMGKFLAERLSDEGMEMSDLLEDEEFLTQIASYSEEYFTAYGAGTGESFEVGMHFLERLLYFQARTGMFVGDAMVREDGDFSPDSPKVFMDGPLKGAPKELIKMMADFNMPSFYQGAKVSDPEARVMVAEQMEQALSMVGMLEDVVEPVSFKRAGSDFSGYKLVGKACSDMMEEDDIEQLQEVFEIEDINAFRKTLSEKNLVIASGVVGDYVLLFVGASEENFVLVDTIEESVCANEKMAFIDDYLKKDILVAGFSDESVQKSVGSIGSLGYRMVGSLSKGMRDGLGEASSLGDTQDIEVLLESLEQQGKELSSQFAMSDCGYVAYLEEGLKMEVFGGSNMPALELDQTATLSSLGEGGETLLFANWTNDKDYNQKVMEYVDSLGETAYMVVKRVAALDIDDPDFNQFKEGFGMFDGSFRKDALGIWQALRGDMSVGMGAESALVIDMNGSLPKVPGVPATLLEQGKMPRISYVSTVDDRSKLQASWKQINQSAENILKVVSEMAGEEIPMQVPMSSEKNELKTWFVPIPMQNDDFVPSVSVSDKLFFASTSKTFSEGLAEKFKSGSEDARKGAWMHVDFKVFNNYAKQWLELVDSNAEELIESESMREDFKSNKPMIENALEAIGSLDEMTMHTRNEGGKSRVSFHLKTK